VNLNRGACGNLCQRRQECPVIDLSEEDRRPIDAPHNRMHGIAGRDNASVSGHVEIWSGRIRGPTLTGNSGLSPVSRSVLTQFLASLSWPPGGYTTSFAGRTRMPRGTGSRHLRLLANWRPASIIIPAAGGRGADRPAHARHGGAVSREREWGESGRGYNQGKKEARLNRGPISPSTRRARDKTPILSPLSSLCPRRGAQKRQKERSGLYPGHHQRSPRLSG
jgi:hypothetical protein